MLLSWAGRFVEAVTGGAKSKLAEIRGVKGQILSIDFHTFRHLEISYFIIMSPIAVLGIPMFEQTKMNVTPWTSDGVEASQGHESVAGSSSELQGWQKKHIWKIGNSLECFRVITKVRWWKGNIWACVKTWRDPNFDGFPFSGYCWRSRVIIDLQFWPLRGGVNLPQESLVMGDQQNT